MARLLTCPDCGATYRVPAEALSPTGQTVKCEACGETWFAPGEDTSTPDALALRDLMEAGKAERVGVERVGVERVDAPAPVGARDMRAVEPANDASLGEDGAWQPRAGGMSAAAGVREGAVMRRRKAKMGIIRWIWFAVLGVFVVGAVVALLLRQDLVETYPQLGPLYGAVGMETTPSGLRLGDVEAEFARVDGVDYLIVRGDVVNLTAEARRAGPVALSLLDVGGEAIASWSVDVRERVPAGGVASFETEYPSPPVDAARLSWAMEYAMSYAD